MDQQSTRTDITVNVEGFWMLQALLDIRHVARELRCRPYVSTDSNDGLNEHPGVAVTREQGIVAGELNEVNEQVAARMRVLAAPDLEVVALLPRGKLLYGVVDDENQLAGFARHPGQRVPGRAGPTRPALGISDSGWQRQRGLIPPPGWVFGPLDCRIETQAKVFASH